MNGNDERAPTAAELAAKRKQWQAALDALTDEERQAYDEEELRTALHDLALADEALADEGFVRHHASWVAPSEPLGTDLPAQPDYDADDEVAQGYLALMRSKGIDNPLPLWGHTLRCDEDGTVLWPGPNRTLHALTEPGGWHRMVEHARRKQQEREDTDREGTETDRETE